MCKIEEAVEWYEKSLKTFNKKDNVTISDDEKYFTYEYEYYEKIDEEYRMGYLISY